MSDHYIYKLKPRCGSIRSKFKLTKQFIRLIRKTEKMHKIANFVNFATKDLNIQTVPRHTICASKLEVQTSFT